MEKVRLVNSGTEATMSSIRLARGHTGRDRIIKFAGNYHGHADMLLAAGGSGVATLGLSGSVGVPLAAVADTLVAPYNVVPNIDTDVACVIVEPVAANMGVIGPAENFLKDLRLACDRAGALLIFDEVITGFRIARGGASEWSKVKPDLACYGKVIGGGLPIGAFGGNSNIMSSLAPEGPVYQAGTLSGNPLATAAGVAALKLLNSEAYSHDQARETGEELYARFFHAMLKRGVAMAPGAYEAMFVGLAHTDEIIDEIVAVAKESALSL
jgi:glutamate-1-semialdehyde 2,1-aminomutase